MNKLLATALALLLFASQSEARQRHHRHHPVSPLTKAARICKLYDSKVAQVILLGDGVTYGFECVNGEGGKVR